MIDLTIHKDALERNIQKARENRVVIPTYEQMKHPNTIPGKLQDRLKRVGLWDLDPLNLFRITWKNEATESGGLYQSVPNYVELPPSLTGVPVRIVALVGKWFPTGCHKVGASYGCLVPRLVTGQFDATVQKAVWPSTGNYCRGGAFNSKLLGVHGVAILPAQMSQERFDWLHSIGAEVIATPGCESNVKEIFDKTNQLKALSGHRRCHRHPVRGHPPPWRPHGGGLLHLRLGGHHRLRRLPQGGLPHHEAGGGRGAAVPHHPEQWLWRPPH